MSPSALLRAQLLSHGTMIKANRLYQLCTSRIGLMATLIRLLLLLAPWKPPQEIHYLQSALFDPTYTLTYWKEAHSLKFLFLSHDLTKMYESSQCKLPPLVLLGLEAVYRWVCQGNDFALHVLVGIFIIILDGIIAVMLSDVATWALDEDDRREGEIQSNMPKAVRPALGHIFPLPGQTNKPSIIKRGEVSSVISMMYYASPLVTLSSFFGVFSSIEVGLLVAATWCASRGSQREKDAAVCLSMLFYWDIAAMFYAVPIALMLDGRASRRRFVAILLLGSFILHGVSMILESDHHWSSVVMRPYDFWKVSPSLSVQWYLSMQVFPRFVNYFRYILFGLPTITVIPLMTRLEQYPVTLVRSFPSYNTLLLDVDHKQAFAHPFASQHNSSPFFGSSGVCFDRTERCWIGICPSRCCFCHQHRSLERERFRAWLPYARSRSHFSSMWSIYGCGSRSEAKRTLCTFNAWPFKSWAPFWCWSLSVGACIAPKPTARHSSS